VKPNRKSLLDQRRILEDQLQPWRSLRDRRSPAAGWIRAIRGALGMTTRQLAARMKSEQAAVVRLEQREPEGSVTLDSLERAARAMKCRLVYALVPEAPHDSLDGILDAQCRALARKLARGVAHSMQLESQGVDAAGTEAQVAALAEELKRALDRRIWE
jgi:predicted DNA-binding mobile mystery protein A